MQDNLKKIGSLRDNYFNWAMGRNMKDDERLKKLISQKKQIENKIASHQARLKTAQRKLETRKKILVGSYFLEKYKNNEAELTNLLDPFLIRDADRELFNLNPLPHNTGKNNEQPD
jgi:hypothetical protein